MLHQELRTLIEATTPPIPAAVAAQIAESLSHGSMLVQTVVVGSYRNREEERFGKYASALSHEIRTPLSAALTGLHILAALDRDEPGPKSEATRQQMIERIERTLWQVRDVFEAVTTVVAPEPASAGGAEEARPLTDVIDALQAEFEDREDGVLFEAEGEIPDATVPYKTVLLVLHNLVRNACSYADPEKPERWVRLSCDRDEEADIWFLRVRDNGIGIPEEEQELIFQRFRRGSGARGQGLGLGLSIVREARRGASGKQDHAADRGCDRCESHEPGVGRTGSCIWQRLRYGSHARGTAGWTERAIGTLQGCESHKRPFSRAPSCDAPPQRVAIRPPTAPLPPTRSDPAEAAPAAFRASAPTVPGSGRVRGRVGAR